MTRTLMAACIALTACTAATLPPAPATPAQAVYEVTAAYAAALTVAVAYDRLPLCGGPALVCSAPSVRAAIKVAVDRADPLVTSAQVVARATSPDATVAANAIAAAVAAVGQLSTIATTLRIN